ncbi:MAG: type II toxin-antitoxin system VapC family toxin [Acidimicrobiales bacterium]
MLEENDQRLPARARQAITPPTTSAMVSVATAWEIEIKRALGKLNVPDDLPEALAAGGYEPLPISLEHAIAAGRLPLWD